jgi:signal transduction histidine kinase
LVVAFILLLLLPAAAVVWLGVRLVIQDRQLESEQLRKQRESAAERVVNDLNERLSTAERNLTSIETPGDDAVRVVLKKDEVETLPSRRLLYQPGLRVDDAFIPQFFAGEALEFKHDLSAAEAAFRPLTTSREPAVRAGALVRLARVLRKNGNGEKALQVYDELASLPEERIDGVPADLVAHHARCRVLEELKRGTELREEADALRAGLFAGKWTIDRGTFAQYEHETASWLSSPAHVPPKAQALAEATAWLWERRGTSGRGAVRLAGVDLGLLWRSSEGEMLALVAGPDFQQHQWFTAAADAVGDGELRIGLMSTAGVVFGKAVDDTDVATVRRPSSDTGLPWDVFVTPGRVAPVGSNRRLAILIGLGFLVVLVVAGGYVIARAVSRELAVARLQSDFVASVSHEFRTPLTSLRQFTDLLSEADDLSPEKRRRFYDAQSRATERLQRLVESLLDFRRMEAGTHPYQRIRLPASPVVESVVGDFRTEAAARGFEVEYRREGDGVVDVDRDALSLALWNLLDNAVKYSGESRRVSMSMAARNGSVEISVRDSGLGVPPDEQREIFRQFVRGREARSRGIKGTGIGLAMVQHIVQGHGGRVTLESAPGQGSTFTIVLPAAE